ncbi:Leishmanolysin, putative [Angomonas deanei]|uniref:Leishmanolysin-like peptidase n=1 Tax=Angomonas deanei TaxID=59799 RepID=A0A7G2CKQ3_9TRYP|nr:Leishmanolysin, putative [Angomonas deanei]
MYPKVLCLTRAALVALLLFSSSTAGERKCIHDEIQLKQAQSGFIAPVVEMDSPQSERQSREALRGIKFRIGVEDLYNPDKYCQTVGQKVTDLQGSQLTCTQYQVLTDDKRNYLINMILPKATSALSNVLKTTPISYSITQSELNHICGNFTPSAELGQLADGDFILMVAAAPTAPGHGGMGTILHEKRERETRSGRDKRIPRVHGP